MTGFILLISVISQADTNAPTTVARTEAQVSGELRSVVAAEIKLYKAMLEDAERIAGTLDKNDVAWHAPTHRRDRPCEYMEALIKRQIALQDELYKMRYVDGQWKLPPTTGRTVPPKAGASGAQ